MISLVALLLSAKAGTAIRGIVGELKEEERADFNVIQGATLTLLALILGFSFSMSISRYDQRKNLEENEANAIGTEYVRADLISPQNGAKVRELMKRYVDLRVTFYQTQNNSELMETNRATAQLQSEMWLAVQPLAQGQPTAIGSLVVGGMNDALNTQGYTQAAWWNRIPVAAWSLLGTFAVGGCFLIGFGAHQTKMVTYVALPLMLSIACFLIADLDSPRG